jgi:hypothetical protein
MKFADLDGNESLGSSTIIPETGGTPKVMSFPPEWCTMESGIRRSASIAPEVK